MGTENDTDTTSNPGSQSDEGSSSGGKSFTQEEVNAIAAREKEQGKRSGVQGLLKLFGLSNEDELKEFAKRVKDQEDAKLSEADRKAKEAEAAKAEAERYKREAETTLLTARKVEALQEAGLTLAAARRVADLVKIQSGDDDAAVKAAVDGLKKDMPALFSKAETEGGNKLPDGSPKPPPRKTQGTATSTDKAREILYQRHPNLKPKN